MILAGGRGRACRVSARWHWRAGRPSHGCSGIPGERFDAGAQCCHEPPAVSRAQLGSAEHSLITATPPPRRRFACATPGSRAATRSSAQTALYAACQRALQPGGVLIATSGRLRAHSRHTYATVLPATIDGIRAHFGNPTQITLFRMPVSTGSMHEKTVHNGGYSRGCYLPVDHALRSAPGADVQARRRRECRRRLSWPPEAGSRSRHSCPCRQVVNGPGIPITACCQKRTAPKRRWASSVRQDYPVCSPSLTRAEEATAVQNGSTCGLSPSIGHAR